ncbi:MAG: cysteine desulfurase [Planctomycetes bacterium]|nr:cysteine desulfurase [Planctomycetota bacterium]
MQPVYLDHAASSPLRPEARAAVLPFLEGEYGNPSSRHPLGARAAEAIARARETLAQALLVEPRQVTFTSGGTEAANLAVLGLARATRARGRHVLVGATEHSCVRACAAELAREGFEVELVPLDAHGEVDLAAFAARVRPDTALLAQMLVNNETGVIAPLARMAKLARARAASVRIAVDAVQAFGKLDCALCELGADALFLSAHKLGGPKGAGALALAPGVSCTPVLHGGGQEHGLRPGTENVAAIVGFGVAARLAQQQRPQWMTHVRRLRARLLERLTGLPGVRVVESASGAQEPGILALMLPGAPAEVRVHHLAQRGVFVSAGAACQSHARELSPALRAIGLDDESIRCLLRLSVNLSTTLEDIERAAQALLEVSRELERAAS